MKIKKWDTESQFARLGSHEWAVTRLFQLARDLPVMNVPLEHLNMYFKYPNLTMRDMVMHIRAVENADLKYPIILDEDGELMDGRHRLMKAILLGKKTIKAVRFMDNPRPCRISQDE